MNVKAMAAGLLASTAMVVSAEAGGFSRGSADLDGLYASEYANEPVISSFGVTFVSPGRSYESVEGVRIVGGAPTAFSQGSVEYGDDFGVPFASVGLALSNDARCVGSYSQPYGADSTYEGDITFFIKSQTIDSYELGATCSYSFDVGRGTAYAIGGLFYERLEYEQARSFTEAFGLAGDSRISVSGREAGFRLGAAYEIPEIALRASLIYRSETDHDFEGRFENTPFTTLTAATLTAQNVTAENVAALAPALIPGILAANPGLTVEQAAGLAAQEVVATLRGQAQIAAFQAFGNNLSARATANATLPQQLELNVRSGIAAGTLAFGSLKWTDWSSIQQIDLFEGINGTAFTNFKGFFRDGYTATVGIGRAFNDDLAGSVAFTYDRGVGTGFAVFTDTYTVSAGVSYDINEIATFQGGGAVLYFTEGVNSREGPGIDGPTGYTAVAPDEFGYALSGSIDIKF